MIILTSSAAIRHTIASYTAFAPIHALDRYAALIDTEPIAWLYILQTGDSADLLARMRGQPFEMWEYIERADGWYQAVFINADDGFGHVVFVPDQPDIDPEILSMCQAHAVEAQR